MLFVIIKYDVYMCKKVVNKDTEWIIFLINPLSENISKYLFNNKNVSDKSYSVRGKEDGNFD